MKHLKLTFVLIVLMSMVGLQAFADWGTEKVEVDGLYYYLDDVYNQAQVSSMPSEKYTGEITIPSSITYNNTNYSVTSIDRWAFAGCTGLTSISIPNSVIIIGYAAFKNCTGLTSISIGNSVMSIGDEAFHICSGLTSITIPNSVTSIGEYAFYGCTGLTSISIPNSVTSIGKRAFDGCTDLTSVTLNSNALVSNTSSSNSLGGIFGGQVTEYVIGDEVTIIGYYAFAGCSSRLTSVTLPNSVTKIRDYAFQNCSGLTSITIPNSVTSIGKNAFVGCTGLTSIIIPNNVMSIGEYAFQYCSGLTSITIPNSVTSIGKEAFYYCTDLTSVTLNSNAIVSNTSSSNKLVGIFGKQVTEYIIGDDVTNIGECAFRDCNSLTSVTIGNNVTSICMFAFQNCSGLTSITIPNSVTSIGQFAFSGCSGLKKVITKDIVAWCMIDFEENSSNPLCYSNHLYSDENTEITNLVIPNSVTSIGQYAFYGCTGLTSVTIPNNVTSIGHYAFSGCSGLISVTIPNNVTSIGYSAFERCSSLNKVIVSDIAVWCSIEFMNMSANPLYCAKHLYSDENTEIKNLVIPNSVTKICDFAFYNCTGLTSIIIPNSVTSIGGLAFEGCSGLTSVTMLNSTPIVIYVDTFPNSGNMTLYVPKGSKEAYLASANWNGFKEIVEIDPSGIEKIMGSENGQAMIFTIDGKRVDNLKKGLNVIRMKDGTIRKAVVK